MRIDINEHGIFTRAIKNGSDKNLLSECRPFVYITMENGAELTPETAFCRDNRVKFRFSGGLCVDFLLEDYRDYVIITVEKADPCIEKLRFVNAVSERRGNDVLAGMALTLETNAAEIPGLADCLWAEGYRRFGISGCAYALIACDLSDMREIMQRITVKHLRNIPYSTIGGAFAADYDAVQGSYIFNFDGVTHENADRWIAAADAVGATQVDFHIGRSQRFGDCVPSLECYPKGYESLQGGIACLHANGIQAGLHTYAHFIAPNSYFVTPIPDKGLGAAHLFTLREEIDANTDELTVNESTDGVNTITGFFVRNTLYLTIDDEVIQFNRVTDRGFSECVRGALGTVKAPHRKGSMVKHLKGCFGLFSPDPDTDLFYKVAEATAEAYNIGDFDMIYLDALDGDDVFAGTEYGWYYGTKFVFEIVKRLKKPAIIEMSTMHHTLWYVRSRMGAWDHATRAYKKLIDAHVANNRLMEECCTLPHTLGWYHFGTVDPTFVCQYDRGFTDDYEYLCQKALRDGYSLAFANLSPALLENNAEVRRYAKIIRKYEKLRLSGALNGIDSAPSYKGEYFLDEKNSRLLPIRYESLFLEGGDHRIAFSGKGEACCLRIENRPAVKTKEEGMQNAMNLSQRRMLIFSK